MANRIERIGLWHGMAELRRRVKVQLAGGELHGAWHELLPLFEHDSLGKYQPDAMFSGLTVAKQVMAECRRRGLDFTPHTWSNGFNMVVNLHAFAAWERRKLIEFPYEPPGFVPAAREGISTALRVAVSTIREKGLRAALTLKKAKDAAQG